VVYQVLKVWALSERAASASACMTIKRKRRIHCAAGAEPTGAGVELRKLGKVQASQREIPDIGVESF